MPHSVFLETFGLSSPNIETVWKLSIRKILLIFYFALIIQPLSHFFLQILRVKLLQFFVLTKTKVKFEGKQIKPMTRKGSRRIKK